MQPLEKGRVIKITTLRENVSLHQQTQFVKNSFVNTTNILIETTEGNYSLMQRIVNTSKYGTNHIYVKLFCK